MLKAVRSLSLAAVLGLLGPTAAGAANAIVGPPGFGADRWIGTTNAAYRVDFENSGTAPVQELRVRVPLDPDLDLASFRLGTAGFGAHLIAVPPGSATHVSVTYFADLGLQVRLVAGVDVELREAVWTFTSLDPATGMPPVDPSIGFLPVNDPTGCGQGFVDFTIRPASGLAGGPSVTAQATITMDASTPIVTNAWLNRVDGVPPSSRMCPEVTTIDSTLVVLRWVADDDSNGSGLRSVSIDGRTPGEPFQPIATDLVGDSLAWAPAWGHEYDFFAIATDNVGNVEPAKSIPEAVVAFGPLAVDEASLHLALHPATPNPFPGATGTVLSFELPVTAEASLGIYDVSGRRVAVPLEPQWLRPGRHAVRFQSTRLPGGVYFCRLRAGAHERTGELVLVR
jgi:hypothetical protein